MNTASAKKPRTSGQVARKYLAKEGPVIPLERMMGFSLGSRRGMVFGFLKRTPGFLSCDRFLFDAVFKWLCDKCRTSQSIFGYCKIFSRWILKTDRLSLSAQVDISSRAVSDFLFDLESQGYSPRSLVLFRDVLRSWFGWLCDRELVAKSPIGRDVIRAFRIDQARVQKGSGLRQALTPREAQKVADWALSEASPEEGLAVALQLTAGLRSQEVANLKRIHLVEHEGIMTLAVPGKGNKLRSIILEPVAVIAAHHYLITRRRKGNRGALLVGPGGGYFSPATIQRWAKKAAAVVGREHEISSHDLRRTAITLLMESGARLEEAQEFAGHSTPLLTHRCYVVRKRKMQATTGLIVSPGEY